MCVSNQKNVLIGIAIAGEVDLSVKGSDQSISMYVGNSLNQIQDLVDAMEESSSLEEDSQIMACLGNCVIGMFHKTLIGRSYMMRILQMRRMTVKQLQK